jgi:hypothetical protein
MTILKISTAMVDTLILKHCPDLDSYDKGSSTLTYVNSEVVGNDGLTRPRSGAIRLVFNILRRGPSPNVL